MDVIRGSSYHQIVEGPTWTAASANAQSIEGRLAKIEDASESKFITEYLGGENVYNRSFTEFQGSKWVDGAPLSYENCHPKIKSNKDWYFSRYPYSEIWASSAEHIKQHPHFEGELKALLH